MWFEAGVGTQDKLYRIWNSLQGQLRVLQRYETDLHNDSQKIALTGKGVMFRRPLRRMIGQFLGSPRIRLRILFYDVWFGQTFGGIGTDGAFIRMTRGRLLRNWVGMRNVLYGVSKRKNLSGIGCHTTYRILRKAMHAILVRGFLGNTL